MPISSAVVCRETMVRAWESVLTCTWFMCDLQTDVFMKEHTGQHSYQETGAHTSTPPLVTFSPQKETSILSPAVCPILNLSGIFSLVTITRVGLIHVHSKFPWVYGACCISVGGCWVAASVKHIVDMCFGIHTCIYVVCI